MATLQSRGMVPFPFQFGESSAWGWQWQKCYHRWFSNLQFPCGWLLWWPLSTIKPPDEWLWFMDLSNLIPAKSVRNPYWKPRPVVRACRYHYLCPLHLHRRHPFPSSKHQHVDRVWAIRATRQGERFWAIPKMDGTPWTIENILLYSNVIRGHGQNDNLV